MAYLIAPEKTTRSSFVVRSYLPGDGRLLAEATNESYDRLREFMPWARPYQNVEQAEKLVRQFRGRYLLATDFNFGVFACDGGRALGGAAFHIEGNDLELQDANVRVWIRTSSAGQGFGAKVLVALTEWGFSEWPWYRLSWRCEIDNHPAIACAQKAGFEEEGVLRQAGFRVDGTRTDIVSFAALRDRWAPKIAAS